MLFAPCNGRCVFWNSGRGTSAKMVSSAAPATHLRPWLARQSSQTATGTPISSHGSCRRVIQGCHLMRAVKSPHEAQRARV